MFCVKCSTEYQPGDKVCPSCGISLPSAEGMNSALLVGSLGAESLPPTGSAFSQPTAPSVDPPYAAFVSAFLGSLLLFSVVMFNVGDAVGRKRWDLRLSTFVATLGGFLLVWVCWQAWRRLVAVEPEGDLRSKLRHRNVTITSVVFALIGLSLAVIIGLVIGQNRAEMTQLATDSNHLEALGTRISQVRDAAEANVSQHILMYEKIEPDVQELESTLQRLRTDLVTYNAKFPDQHQQTAEQIAGVEKGLQRARLLKQQIAVAKTIKPLEPDQQWIAWQAQMQPLLDREDALDHPK